MHTVLDHKTEVQSEIQCEALDERVYTIFTRKIPGALQRLWVNTDLGTSRHSNEGVIYSNEGLSKNKQPDTENYKWNRIIDEQKSIEIWSQQKTEKLVRFITNITINCRETGLAGMPVNGVENSKKEVYMCVDTQLEP